MKHFLVLLLCSTSCLASTLELAETPMAPSSSSAIAYEECVSEKYNSCNFQMCSLKSSISESPNCQDICKEQAQSACKEQKS